MRFDDETDVIRAEAAVELDLHEKKVVKPSGPYHRADIALMLQADAVCRKNQSWPLIGSAEILALSERLNSTPLGFDFDPKDGTLWFTEERSDMIGCLQIRPDHQT